MHEALRNPYILPNGNEIFIFPLDIWLAAKLSAFFDRGIGDPILSKDLEDIYFVMDGACDLLSAFTSSNRAIVEFISNSFKTIAANPNCVEALDGMLSPVGSRRVQRARNLIDECARLRTTVQV